MKNLTSKSKQELIQIAFEIVKEKVDFTKQSNYDITITENEDNYWISKKSKSSFSKLLSIKKQENKEQK